MNRNRKPGDQGRNRAAQLVKVTLTLNKAQRKENVLAPLQSLSITAQSVVAHALDTFGSEKKAAHWMSRPNPLLQGRTPSKVVQSDPSAVEAALVRIDHGVYV